MSGLPVDRTAEASVAGETRFPRLALGVYVLLVAYASLHPLSGWRDPGTPALAFLTAPLPRWVTPFDVVSNVLGYLPLGALCTLALHPRWKGFAAILAALTCGAGLSVVLETAQTFLPARVPSNLDVLANAAGALAGGIVGVLLGPRFLGRGPLRRLRAHTITAGTEAELGL
ncbi:MAG TPA: VanZ family protein, partial [Burkholderiales bacterium]|nr:VanZ family protein [Burkholderiales bacterium]